MCAFFERKYCMQTFNVVVIPYKSISWSYFHKILFFCNSVIFFLTNRTRCFVLVFFPCFSFFVLFLVLFLGFFFLFFGFFVFCFEYVVVVVVVLLFIFVFFSIDFIYMYRVTKVYYGIILLYKTDYELLRCFKGIHTQIEEYTYLLTIRKIIYTFLYYENTTNIPVMSFSCLKKLLVFSFSGNF